MWFIELIAGIFLLVLSFVIIHGIVVTYDSIKKEGLREIIAAVGSILGFLFFCWAIGHAIIKLLVGG